MTSLNASFVDTFDFRTPNVARVVHGRQCARREVAAQLQQWGVARAVVVVNGSLADSTDVRKLMLSLHQGAVTARLFTGRMQHCPLETARELMRVGLAHQAAALVAVGGSSVSDTAKAANLLATFAPQGPAPSIAALRDSIDPAVPLAWRLVAVPTTLSGGEFTSVVGITDRSTGCKAVLRHPGLGAGTILLDPVLQRLTPDRLWAATGFKLLDHAVERLLARNHRALIDAQCLFGIRWLRQVLEPSVGATASREARAACLQALWVIQSAHGNVGTGVSHALAHQLGSACGLDHGSGSAICLPATLRLLDESGRIAPARADLLASAFDVEPGPGAIRRVTTALEDLRRRLQLPGTLPEAGVAAVDVHRVALATLEDPTIAASPGAPFTHEELVALLETLNETRWPASHEA